ncbi:hypothetical protein [Catalinimonas niigatensis]|uniref:hypothetical protein n=1 Tax=Catalinimonas niigatensis TaxID=1397264 RepID=UPI00266566DF|nr:hypothetical protein [Catalinimonas niigatensis]WPP52315.1 hypothetical protein PZB72_07970 [Catalinimonas niigatensis]
MDYTTRPTLLWISLCLFLFASCDKLCDCDDDPKPCLFSYGKVSFTPTPAEEQIVNPSFTQGESDGTFTASPAGLDLDADSGAININNSEPGQEYTITYTLEDGKTTCSTSIYIGEAEKEVETCVLQYEYKVYFPNSTQPKFAKPAPPFDKPSEFNGKFTVEPQGLDIDPSTGQFSVNGSQAGITYQITYTSEDKLSTCQTSVTIAGLDIKDTLVDVSAEEASLIPQFSANADVEIGNIVYTARNIGNEPPLILNTETGAVDIKQTLINIDQQEFDGNGDTPAIPSGFSRKYIIDYQVFDPQGEVITSNSTDLLIYWYEDIESIPEELINLVNYKEQYSNGKILDRPNTAVGHNNYNR